jgi:hypothetical protein
MIAALRDGLPLPEVQIEAIELALASALTQEGLDGSRDMNRRGIDIDELVGSLRLRYPR